MSARLRPSSRSNKVDTKGAASVGKGEMPRQKQSSRAESSESMAKLNDTASFPSLEILEAGDTGGMSDRSSSCLSLGSRSKSNLGSVPPRSDSSLSQRVATPTKHVSLTAVRRKQESDQPFEPELDWREFTRSNSSLKLGGRTPSSTFLHSTSVEEKTSTHHTYAEGSDPKAESQALSSDKSLEAEERSQVQAVGEGKSQPAEQKESSDDDDGDSDSEGEPRTAPNELLMEFLDCVMKKEFKTAEKLCRMILIYEPANPEALTFHPIIMEKLQLDLEAAEEGEEDGSGDDDDEDEDDDDDDDSDEDSSSENDSSEEDNSDGAEEGAVPPRPDSGIGM